MECSCPKWYSFHQLPNNDDEDKRNWLKHLNLKQPPKYCNVCSFHFVDKAPTLENPYPTLYLGYEKPPEKKRRRVVRMIVDSQVATTTGKLALGLTAKFGIDARFFSCIIKLAYSILTVLKASLIFCA